MGNLKFKAAIIFAVAVVSSCQRIEPEQNPGAAEYTLETKGEGQGLFYYYFDEKVFLKERKDMLFIRFEDNESREGFLADLNNLSIIKPWEADGQKSYVKGNAFNMLVVQTHSGEPIPIDLFKEINNGKGVRVASFLTENNGELAAPTDEFIVRLRRLSDITRLEKLVEQFGCEMSHREWFDPEVFFVRCKSCVENSMIHIANFFYETGLFEYTSPDFILFNATQSSDPYYTDQWNMYNTGQYGASGIDIKVSPAWYYTEGSDDIVVAVIDVGVDLTHPDLATNMVTGYDAINNTVGGSPASDAANHGTPVAGIIAAVKDNNIGISGVAPGCKIMPICAGDGTSIDPNAAASGIAWARNQGADVINCSWSSQYYNSSIGSEITIAENQGRGGKGIVVVAAAGNQGQAVRYPAALNNVIAVGAISYDGKRKTETSPDGASWASSYGSSLNVVAPGVRIPTTDRVGVKGYNSSSQSTGLDYSNTDYTKIFQGTSSSTPQVAGVAALMLSVFPDLTWEQVKRGIELSCTKLNSYSYQTDSYNPSGTRNDEVGYGLVNAYAALQQVAPKIHFNLANFSSYDLQGVGITLSGTINGVSTTFFSTVFFDLASGEEHWGQGNPIFATPGATISNLNLMISAIDPYSGGDLRIGSAMDYSVVTDFEDFYFGPAGNIYYGHLSNSYVPTESSTIYIEISDPLQYRVNKRINTGEESSEVVVK